MSIQSTRQSRIQEAFRLHQEGKSYAEIGKALGVSLSSAHNYLKAHPDYAPRKKRPNPLTPADLEDYRLGKKTSTELGKAYKASQPSVLQWIRDLGGTVHKKGRTPVYRGSEEDLRQWAREGLSTREMAQRVRASEETIRRTLADLGIERLPAKARTEKNHFWGGGLLVDKHGYILAKSPDHPNRTSAGYVRLHRLVMERSLGRLLSRQEVVDHLDGDTSDNRIRNLVLYASNGEHLSATLTGRHAIRDRLSKGERSQQQREAVQRARDRVEATHRERASGERLSLSELDLWIDELATGARTP